MERLPLSANERGRPRGLDYPWKRDQALSASWSLALRLITPLTFIAIWQLLCSSGALGATPSPWQVLGALWSLATKPDPYLHATLWSHLGASLFRVIGGFFIALLVGVGLGLLMGWYPLVYHSLHPLVEMIRPVPPFAWVVLAILWFKIGNAPAIFIVFLGAVFPMIINTVSGVEAVDRVLCEAAATLGANSRQILWKVVIPSALPQIITGLRVGLGVAWMSLIAAEMVGVGGRGLGLIIDISKSTWKLDYSVAAMVVIGLIGFFLDFLMRRAERALLRWR